jgi:hypothetical protein
MQQKFWNVGYLLVEMAPLLFRFHTRIGRVVRHHRLHNEAASLEVKTAIGEIKNLASRLIVSFAVGTGIIEVQEADLGMEFAGSNLTLYLRCKLKINGYYRRTFFCVIP